MPCHCVRSLWWGCCGHAALSSSCSCASASASASVSLSVHSTVWMLLANLVRVPINGYTFRVLVSASSYVNSTLRNNNNNNNNNNNPSATVFPFILQMDGWLTICTSAIALDAPYIYSLWKELSIELLTLTHSRANKQTNKRMLTHNLIVLASGIGIGTLYVLYYDYFLCQSNGNKCDNSSWCLEFATFNATMTGEGFINGQGTRSHPWGTSAIPATVQ